MIRTQLELMAAIISKVSPLVLALEEPVVIRGLNGLRFKGGTVRPAALANNEAPMIKLIGCSDIAFDGVTFEGVTVDKVHRGVGIHAVDCTDIVIEKSDFTRTYRGIVLWRTIGFDVLRNDFATMQSDGVNLSECENGTIQGNRFTGFVPRSNAANTLEHPDGIQIYAAAAQKPSRNITIADNLFTDDLETPFQSIQVKTENPSRHTGIHLLRNLSRNALWNAYSMAYCDDSSIIDNVAGCDEGVKSLNQGVIPWIRVEHCEPWMEGNTAPLYKIGGKAFGFVPAGNVAKMLSPDELAKAVADWEAEWRPAPPSAAKPTLADLLAQVDALRASIILAMTEEPS